MTVRVPVTIHARFCLHEFGVNPGPLRVLSQCHPNAPDTLAAAVLAGSICVTLTRVFLQGLLWILTDLPAVGALLLLLPATRSPGSLQNGQWQGSPEFTRSQCRAPQAMPKDPAADPALCCSLLHPSST